MSEYRKVDAFRDADGEPVEIGHLEGKVIVAVGLSGEAHLAGESRERFQRAFTEAGRQAEAHGADRTCRYCGGAIEPCTATASDCKGWVHVSGGTGPHRCDGDPRSPAAEPLAEVSRG